LIEKNGFILLHKPKDITSFTALGEIKRKLQTNKVGHTGTLDKFASGLLIVLSGKYTKFSQLFTHLDKEYIARIKFGVSTDTLDPEGEIIEQSDIPTADKVASTVKCFIGEIDQVPPLYSAIHQNGERLYKKAMRGGEIKLKPRKVFIYRIKQLMYEPPFLDLLVHCSGGTYIRALARDIGKASLSCAYVCELSRTKIGNFQLSDAVFPSEFLPEKHVRKAEEFLPFCKGIGIAHIDPSYKEKILNGCRLYDHYFLIHPQKEGIYALFNENSLIALVEKKAEGFRYCAVFKED
jgi:tRNA pseudouridine55 synthase